MRPFPPDCGLCQQGNQRFTRRLRLTLRNGEALGRCRGLTSNRKRRVTMKLMANHGRIVTVVTYPDFPHLTRIQSDARVVSSLKTVRNAKLELERAHRWNPIVSTPEIDECLKIFRAGNVASMRATRLMGPNVAC